jgi:subtilisin family serine protease
VPSIIVKEPAKVAMNVKDKKDSKVKETKEVKSEEVKEAKETHEVKHEVSQHAEEASTATGDVAANTGSAAGGVSGWSIGLGALVLGGLAAAAGGGGGSSDSGDGSTITSTSWSSESGWGEIDVLAALSSLTGEEYEDTADADDVSWGINRSDANDVNALGYAGEGVTIAIIDSGIDMDNTDFAPISADSWDFVEGDNTPDDDYVYHDEINDIYYYGHGTVGASIIGALDNGVGLTGAAHDAELMILKVFDADGNVNYDATYGSDIIEAIYYAVDHDADIINMSLGGYTNELNSFYRGALEYADDHGVLVVISSGNCGDGACDIYGEVISDEPLSPAVAAQEIDGVLAVGAIDINGHIADWSNPSGSSTAYGYVVAAGVQVEGYDAHGNEVYEDGTSFSAPLVAAEAAILLSTGLIADNASTDEALVNLITSSANAVLV